MHARRWDPGLRDLPIRSFLRPLGGAAVPFRARMHGPQHPDHPGS